MDRTWNLYRFDQVRYAELRPMLRTATRPAEFAALADSVETDAIIEALIEGDLDAVSVRQAFLITLCCNGEPLECPRGLPRILQRMRSDIRAETGSEILSDAIVGSRNIERWLLPTGKLAGFLTPGEAASVLESFRSSDSRHSARGRARRRPARRGGLFNAVATFFRRLFDQGLASDEMQRLLRELLEAAVANNEGIAVIMGRP